MIPLHITNNYYNFNGNGTMSLASTNEQPLIYLNQIVNKNTKYILPPHQDKNIL